MIRCRNGRLYTGITTDVERRFEEHESGDKKGSKYLRGKTPLKLVMKKRIGSRSLALKIEAKVKKLSKVKKEMLVDGKINVRDLKKNIINTRYNLQRHRMKCCTGPQWLRNLLCARVEIVSDPLVFSKGKVSANTPCN